MRGKTVSVIQIAATYIGTVVGAGFASGLSIMQFFTVYGVYGMIGILVSIALFVWLGIKMMVLAHRIKAYSYQEFNIYLFGDRLGRLANGASFIILFGVTSVMLSGSGSIFQEQLGLSEQLGIITTIFLIYLVLTRQLKGILLINTAVVPMMLFFSLLIAIDSVSAKAILQTNGWQAEQAHSLKWFISPFAYAALNFATLQAVLVPLGCEEKDERVLVLGGLWGGAGIGFLLLVSHIAMNGLMPGIMKFSIPMAEVIREFGPLMHLLFLFIIYGEIFTTLIGNVFGMSRQIQSLYPSLSSNLLVVTILFACFLVSQMGFSALLTRLYTLFGYAGLVLVAVLAAKRMPIK